MKLICLSQQGSTAAYPQNHIGSEGLGGWAKAFHIAIDVADM